MSGWPKQYTRIVLMCAFGGLLALLLAAGWAALAMLDETHARESVARADFLARNECLMKLDARLIVSGPEPGINPQGLRRQLQSYPGARSPREQALLDQLAEALAAQEQSATAPRRIRVLEATEQVVVWNHDRFRGADGELVASFERLRGNLRTLLSILLGSSLLLAVGSVVFMARQNSELIESRDARERLAARLLEAQEQERRSLSRELHDEVGQSLGALLTNVGRLAGQLPPEDIRLREEAAHIRALAERSVAAVRNIALLLRPSMLDDLGLAAALEWQGREISRNSEMEVEVNPEGVPASLNEEQNICVYRVVQEALNNAARHSGAKRARVTVTKKAGTLTVEIRDDGRGFDARKTRGLGLLGMEERIRHVKGTLRLHSAPGEGTSVVAEIPLA